MFKLTDPSDPDDNQINDTAPDTAPSGHAIPNVPTTDEGPTDKPQFEEPIASPSVVGEEDPFSGDATSGEPADIDTELEKVGLKNDEDGPKPLSSDDID